jgi:hypothetical protein
LAVAKLLLHAQQPCMPASFGTRLRTQRERRQIELTAISEQTKIKESLLEALERDDVSRWPGGVFRRAYVRAYAHAIGLNPDIVVQEFLRLYPDPDEIAKEPIAPIAGNGRRPPTRIQFLIGSAMSGLFRPRRDEPAPGGTERTSERSRAAAVAEPSVRDYELSALAEVCGGIVRAQPDEMPKLLRDAAHLLNAATLSLWIWDADAAVLRPSLAYGYSREALACLPAVPANADNALAAAFRSQGRCVVPGSNVATGAVVIPVQRPNGCAGVFAVEFRNGGEHRECDCAMVAILAAQLSARLTDESAAPLSIFPSGRPL